LKLLGAVTLGTAALSGVAAANEENIHAPHYPWTSNGPFSAFDHRSIRRGHEVYANVCATCHSLDGICYRNMVDVIYTEEQGKRIAEEIEVVDGPNDDGDMFERPGKLSDHFPNPYRNEEEARAINNGAYPPDLTLIVSARHGGPDYVMALLLGYEDPPEGVTVRPGLYYNPYFPGAKIGMPRQLNDGGVEYTDGTPATASQQAKDVSTFLHWCSKPEHDDRKRQGVKWLSALFLMALVSGYRKRVVWAPVKTRKISYLS